MRRQRAIGVFARAALFFGVLLGLIGGGLTGTFLSALLQSGGRTPPPLPLLIPLMMIACGAVFGLLFAYADYRITRATPDDRLDPTGAVRQRVTLEVPLPPDKALEAASRVAFEELDWAIESRAEGHLRLRAPASFRSLGEQIDIDLHPTPGGSAALICSRPLSPIIVIDYNKNRENVLLLRESLQRACRASASGEV
jgi:hypothetical protein